MGNDNHRLFMRNSVQFGLKCRNLPIRPAPRRFCPLDLDRLQMSTQGQCRPNANVDPTPEDDTFLDIQPQAMPQISQASNAGSFRACSNRY
jgi:hypothetical protein